MTNSRNPKSATQRLQESIDMHDLSTMELMRIVRDANHELHLRIDHLTPDGDDLAHSNFHRREQDREINERQYALLRRAQMWAGVRIGVVALIVVMVGMALYASFTRG